METKQRPEQAFAAGAIRAAIWKNPGKTSDGQETDFYSVRLERRYKDANGQWQSTNSFRVNDLPKAQLLLAKAFEHLVFQEREDNDAAP